MHHCYKTAILLKFSYTVASLATVTFIGFNGFMLRDMLMSKVKVFWFSHVYSLKDSLLRTCFWHLAESTAERYLMF